MRAYLWPRAHSRGVVVENPSAEAFDALLRDHRFVVVDFHASWCAPCRSYSPKFHRASREVKRRLPDASVAFASVDVDLRQDIARRHAIRSVPTTLVVAQKRGLFGRERRVEALRFSGDRAWPELVRSLVAALR